MDSTCANPKDLKDFEGKLNDDISGKKIAIIDNFLKEEMQEEVREKRSYFRKNRIPIW